MLIGLAGCAKYNARPMKPLMHLENTREQAVSFSYQVFDRHDCKKYLGKNTINKGYQPIQVTIVNNSDHYLTMNLDSFNCECINPDEVAEKMHTNTVGRAVGYGIPAWLLFPVLVIPAIVDGVGSSKANKKLDADYDDKALSNRTIAPYTTVNGLIFISTDDYAGNITVTLTDEENHKRYVLSNLRHEAKV
jgi:hypothetical protein